MLTVVECGYLLERRGALVDRERGGKMVRSGRGIETNKATQVFAIDKAVVGRRVI